MRGLRTCGGAPAGPVTWTALVRPSSPDSTKNSTCSPSARLRKPSVMMLVCMWHSATQSSMTSMQERDRSLFSVEERNLSIRKASQNPS